MNEAHELAEKIEQGVYEKMRKEQSSAEEDKEIVAALEKRIPDKESMTNP